MVVMMMESAGMAVHDLGVDIDSEKFVVISKKKLSGCCLSALLTTTMPMMKQIINAIVKIGLGAQVKILVGGAPVT